MTRSGRFSSSAAPGEVAGGPVRRRHVRRGRTRPAGGSPAPSRSTCGAWTACSRSTRSPPAALQPGLRAPRPRRCSPRKASPWATSRSRSSGPPSAVSPPPAPAARPPPATAASTSWSWLSASPPRGHPRPRRAPESAAGPDLRQLVLGSEGAFGVITSVTVAVRPVPAARLRGLALRSFAEGSAALRGSPRTGRARPCCASPTRPRPCSASPAGRDRPGAPAAGCPAIAGYEGRGGRLVPPARRRRPARCGGTPLGGAGERWAPAATAAPTCATPCSTRARSSRRWRRRPSGPASPRSTRPSAPRSPFAHGAGHPAPDPVPHLARLPVRRLAVLHGRLRPARGPVAQWHPGQARGQRGDPRRRRHHHPPPRRRHRPPGLVLREAGPLAVRGPGAVKRRSTRPASSTPGSSWRKRGGGGARERERSPPPLAELAVDFGANLQPGQILSHGLGAGQGAARPGDRRAPTRAPSSSISRVRLLFQARPRPARRSETLESCRRGSGDRILALGRAPCRRTRSPGRSPPAWTISTPRCRPRPTPAVREARR